jgi:hypothetical protein
LVVSFLFFLCLSFPFLISFYSFLLGVALSFGIDDFHDTTNNPQQQPGSQGEYKKEKLKLYIKPERRLPSHSI